MHVLIVGYGKIGKIKAGIWKSLGADVHVYEINTRLHSQIMHDGFKLYKSSQIFTGIIDISTPADQHYEALKWCTTQKNITIKTVLIEKPLASSRSELRQFQIFFQKHSLLSKKVFVNESYFQSTALQFIQQDIKQQNTSITDITIELSKNRLKDNLEGRFFDHSLESIGIEVPHMLAILMMFNIPISFIPSGKAQLFVDPKYRLNQGFIYKNIQSVPTIELVSFLGSFRNSPESTSVETPIIRRLHITTDTTSYRVIFDPIPNFNRYLTRIDMYYKGRLRETRVFEDNHLMNHLKLFMTDNYKLHKGLIGIMNAIGITEALLDMRDMSIEKQLNSSIISKNTVTTKKELHNGNRI